jgi:hypothetical protein
VFDAVMVISLAIPARLLRALADQPRRAPGAGR